LILLLYILAVVSVQRAEQSNVPQQQQQITGASQMIYPAAPIRYYTPEYMQQRMNSLFNLISINVCFSLK
jgi:hypothetical protein